MKPIRHLLLLLACLSLPAAAFSQVENLTADSAFFQRQAKIYQKWLDNAGLGELLRVRSLDVQPRYVALYLEFSFSDRDSVSAAWTQLKTGFERNNPFSLEQQLFYKQTALMELRQDAANVLIFDTYDSRITPCFKRDIYFEADTVAVKASDCKLVENRIVFDPSDFSNLKKSARLKGNALAPAGSQPTPAELRRRYPKEVVFDLILNYAIQRYEPPVCDQRYPKVHRLETKHELRFEVTDLCREVIQSGNPKICEILRFFRHDCNWIKREKLIFTFSYLVTPDGFTLACTIDGLYGSGFYENVQRGAYISMEGDFDRELEFYAEVLKEEIRQLLKDNY